MAAFREYQRRRKRRRQMIIAAISAILVVAMVLLLLQACSSGDQNSGVEEGVEGERGTTGEAATTQPEQQQMEQPYAALEPSRNATPIAQSVTEADTQLAVGAENGGVVIEQYDNPGMPQEETGMETTGDDEGTGMTPYSGPNRSVPLGQMLLKGQQDNSDGPLGENRIVAYYGTPTSDLMGILGEYEPDEMMRLLKEQTQAYSDADPERPAIPAIEFIATVAQRDPGPEDLYVASVDPEYIEQYSELARENDALLILDVQLGRASVMDEVRQLERFLKEPHVHLAIDTEYAVEEGEIPGINLGTVDGPEIQEAVEYLDNMVKEEGIPDKILMVHQFEVGIVTNKQDIRPTDDVQVVLHADGFGGPEAKFSKYGTLVRAQPIQYGAFKVFYNQDTPVLEPSQVLALDPAPSIITYQ